MNKQSNHWVIAQISDCHLFADKMKTHHGACVFDNLVAVLTDIKKQPQVTHIVFTGDLTQDHSEASYQRFVEAFEQTEINIPCYYLAGNHDEHSLLDKYLSNPPFVQGKQVSNQYWQLNLVESKSDTPSGYVETEALAHLVNYESDNVAQIIFMHHHAKDVGYFIDRHGLNNKLEFWQQLQSIDLLKAIACGHVHQGLLLEDNTDCNDIPLFTCPATSIQFDKNKNTVACNGQGPGYRIFTLNADQTFESRVVYLNGGLAN